MLEEGVLCEMISENFVSSMSLEKAYQLLVNIRKSKLQNYYDYNIATWGKLHQLWQPFDKILKDTGFTLELLAKMEMKTHPFTHINPGIMVANNHKAAFQWNELFTNLPSPICDTCSKAFKETVENNFKESNLSTSDFENTLILPFAQQVTFSENFQELIIQEIILISLEKHEPGIRTEAKTYLLLSYHFSQDSFLKMDINSNISVK